MVLKTIRKMKFTVIFMTVLFAGGLLAVGCSCNKGEKSEKGGEAQKVEKGAKTQETSKQRTPASENEQETDRMKSRGPPPEITEPCKGLNVGDSCTVVLSEGGDIPGSCVMSKISNVLACMPKPRPGNS